MDVSADTPAKTDDDRWLRVTVGVTALGALGALVMSIAHAGIEVPVVSALGPQGGAVPPAAISFGVGALLFAGVAFGLARRQSWAWAIGLAVNALAFGAAAFPYRGIGSVAGMAVSVAAIALLLSGPVRRVVLANTSSA